MEKVQLHFKDLKSIPNQLDKISAIDPTLIFAFGAFQSFESPEILKQLSQKNPKAIVIGCSTSGEINNDGIYDNTLVATAVKLHKTKLNAASSEIKGMDDSFAAGQRLAAKLELAGLKSIFVLGCGLNINGSALIDGIRQVVGQKVILTGGLAGDSGRFAKTFTTLNGQIASNQIVAVGFYGEHFHLSFGSRGGWQAFGPVRKVTKSQRNILFELDGEPALDIYKVYLGDKAAELPGSGLLYPFALLDNAKATTGVIRTILGVDENAKSVTFAGDIPENGLVRLMHTNNSGLVDGAREAATLVKGSGKDTTADGGLAILISCVGRKLIMGSDTEEELDVVRESLSPGAMLAGFYSYGEICPETGFAECKLHNQTMTISYMYED